MANYCDACANCEPFTFDLNQAIETVCCAKEESAILGLLRSVPPKMLNEAIQNLYCNDLTILHLIKSLKIKSNNSTLNTNRVGDRRSRSAFQVDDDTQLFKIEAPKLVQHTGTTTLYNTAESGKEIRAKIKYFATTSYGINVNENYDVWELTLVKGYNEIVFSNVDEMISEIENDGYTNLGESYDLLSKSKSITMYIPDSMYMENVIGQGLWIKKFRDTSSSNPNQYVDTYYLDKRSLDTLKTIGANKTFKNARDLKQ